MLQRVPRQTLCLHPDRDAGSTANVPVSGSSGGMFPSPGEEQGVSLQKQRSWVAEQELMRWGLWESQPPDPVLSGFACPSSENGHLFKGLLSPAGSLSPRWCLLQRWVLRAQGWLQSSPDRGTGESQPLPGRCPHPGLSLGDACASLPLWARTCVPPHVDLLCPSAGWGSAGLGKARVWACSLFACLMPLRVGFLRKKIYLFFSLLVRERC